jgi:hypothetical protein
VGVLPPGASAVIDVVVRTSTAVGTYTNTATVTPHGVVEPLEYQDNNSASATTSVATPTSSGSASAFVPGGGSLTFAGHVLRVPDGVPGVFVTMSLTTDHGTAPCGTNPCGQGLRVVYDADPNYQVTDPDHPISVDVVFPAPRCADDDHHHDGYEDHEDAACPIELYSKKPPSPLPTKVPDCDGAGRDGRPGSGRARVNGIYQLCRDRVYRSGGIHQVVLMISTDPDLLPPISVGR